LKAVGYINSYRLHELDREIELKIQRERIAEFCEKHSMQLINVYEEPSESRDDYKPALLQMLNDAANKTFDSVVVLKLDKFGQEGVVKRWVLDELKKHNIQIHSLTENILQKPIATPEEAATKANDIKQKVKDIPSLPEIVTKVMELVQDPNSSASSLSKVISHDPGLTSRVLRLVNSAYYGFPKQISSIQHAIMILGFTTMRGLVLSSSIYKIFSPKGDSSRMLDYKKFWKHSLITAIAAKNIKNYLKIQEQEDIFSAAILHDIGKIILDQYDHGNYIQAFMQAPNFLNHNLVLHAEQSFCGVTHTEIGSMVADNWNLPLSITEVIKYHHNPSEAKEYKNLSGMVYVGNILSHIILDQTPIELDLFDQDILEELGIQQDDLLNINMKVTEELQNVGDLESFFK